MRIREQAADAHFSERCCFEALYQLPNELTGLGLELHVKVVNQGYLDRNVYVMRGAERIRLGTVSGNSSQVLTIPASVVPSLVTLRFVADPIGGRTPTATEEISVAPGDQVVLTIPPG